MAKIEFRSILLAESEYVTLLALLEKHNSREFDDLYAEIDSATVMADENLPGNVVRMRSVVAFKDDETNEIKRVQVVYPGEVSESLATVSVLAPVGAALIGLREGESIHWPLPNGRQKTITVVKVDKP